MTCDLSSEKNHNYFFLKGDGECATLARSIDWSTTPIGNPQHWPQSLRNTVAMLFSSQFPMLLWWGDELIQFYNDAYRPSLGDNGKHPAAMGQRGADCWPEIWEFIYPLIQQVRTTGKAAWYEDLLLPIFRNGQIEDVYWTFSYSAVYGDDGTIEGVLVVCTETTDKIKNFIDLNNNKVELEFAIEAAELGTWDLNTVTGKFSSNARLKSWFGLEPDQEVPLSMATDVIADKDRKRVLDAIDQATRYESGGKYEIEYTIIHPITKSERIVLAKGNTWFNENKNPYRFNGTLQDITAARKAEAKVLEARQLTDLAIKSVGIGLFKVDFTTNEFEYTPEFAAIMTGNPNDKNLTRMGIIRHVHPDDMHLRDEAVKAGIETGEFYYAPRVVWDDGSVHRVVIVGAQISDDTGKPTAFSGTIRDITSQEAQQLALEESENRFRSMIEQSQVATCLFIGREMKIEIANDSMISVWGKDRSIIGMTLAEALPELKGQPFFELLDNVFITGKTYEAKAARADLVVGGLLQTFYFDFSYTAIYNTQGEIYGVMDMAVDVTKQVLAQQLIDEQQRRLLASFEESPVAIATIDKENLTFRTANKFYCQLVGRTHDEIIDKPLLEALPELIGQGFDDLLREVIATGEPFIAKEVSAKLMRNGILETIYVGLNYQPRFDENNEVYGILVVATDVTEQVVTRKEIERSESKFRALIMDSPVAMALFIGAEYRVEVANDLMLDYLGKDKSFIGELYREAAPELESQGFFNIMDAVFESGITYEAIDAKVDLMHKGVIKTGYFNYTYTPLFDNYQKVYAIILTAIEVTEQVLSRKRIEDTQKALHNAIELAELSTWKLDIKNNVFIYSQRFMDWLGFSEDTKNIDDAYNPLPEEYRESVSAAVNKVLEPGSSGLYDNEHPIVNRLTGQVRIIHANAQLYFDANGEPEFLSGTAQDVTKDRKLQQELEFKVRQRTEEIERVNAELATLNQSLEVNNQELQQFAYIASHDLQEPVRKIAVYMQLLEASIGTVSEKSQDYINKINTSAKRMTNLVRDVLGFSQLSGVTDTFEPVDLNDIVAEIIAEYELVIEQKHAKIESEKLPVIDGIPLQLSQLFGNLISNSLKYVDAEVAPKIKITVTEATSDDLHFTGALPHSPYCKLQLTDNGIGFEQEYAEKIFAIFQRLHAKTAYSGTGIGLAMCRKIMQNHHGWISAQSESGKGATFTILLPLTQNNSM